MTSTPAVARAAREEALLARARAAAGERHVQAIAALTLLGGVFRFSTLGLQSFWYDEAQTAWLTQRSFLGMLRQLPKQESTPPLFYSLAWVWTRLVGTGEVSMRTVSAVAGTATIPVAYLVAQRFVSRRAGLVAAAIAACSPYLIWYSQEARSYSLLCLLSGVTVLLVLRALEQPTPGRIAAWAVAAAAALTTHYFAIFLVVPETIWLLRRRGRKPVLLATGWIALVGAALLPLALRQRSGGYTEWVAARPFRARATEIAQDFTIGVVNSGTLRHAAFVPGGLLVVAALALLWRRGSKKEHHGALIAGALGAAAVGLALLLAAVGLDYVYHRNLIEAWVALVVVPAAGLGAKAAGRLGIGLTAAYCVLGLAITIAIDVTPRLQREDFRDVTSVVTAASAPRVLVVSPFAQPFAWYDRKVMLLPEGGVSARSFTLVYTDKREAPPTLAGFRRVWYGRIYRMPAARYVSFRPRLVRRDTLEHDVSLFTRSPVALLTRH